MTTPRICHVSTVHKGLDVRIYHKECVSLSSEGYHVSLVIQYPDSDKPDDVTIVPLSAARSRLERATVGQFKAVAAALSTGSEIYHLHDPELVLAGLVLKVIGKKVVYDVHEDLPRQILSKYWIPKPVRKLVASSFEYLENFAARRFDAVVTATPFIRDRFVGIGSNAVDVNNYPLLGEFDQYYPWSHKERAVCYLGGIHDIRGLFEMIEAMGRTDVRLLLAGPFALHEQQERAMTIRGWENVQYLGVLKRAGLAEVFARSMCGLLLFHPEPNHVDAQPNKMFEYMSAGIPVIASDFPLWREIIVGNDCGICVNPLDPDEIARAILWMADNPAAAERMGRNGRKAVEEKYHWEVESEKLLRVYASLLED